MSYLPPEEVSARLWFDGWRPGGPVTFHELRHGYHEWVLTVGPDGFVTQLQAAALLSVHPQTVLDWVQRGQIAYAPAPDGTALVPLSEVARIELHRRQGRRGTGVPARPRG